MSTQTAFDLFLNEDSDIYESRPSAEEGHTKACLASAMICAIQNWRDEPSTTDHDFRLMAQDNEFLATADDYLNVSQISDCICPPKVREQEWTWTISYKRTDRPGNFHHEVYCTLEAAVLETEELRAYTPESYGYTVGRAVYGVPSGLGSFHFWMALDAGPNMAQPSPIELIEKYN